MSSETGNRRSTARNRTAVRVEWKTSPARRSSTVLTQSIVRSVRLTAVPSAGASSEMSHTISDAQGYRANKGRTLAGDETHAGAEHFCRTIRATSDLKPTANVLVAGCGKGHEALFICKDLGAKLTGIDVDQQWEPVETWGADIPDFELLVGSVLELPFADDSFDVIFYHHVIEHVSNPARSLRELARVLRPGGAIYIGTPNRHRAVGYLGSFDASTAQKLQWNIHDYKARIQGRFRNELGAHAGFSEKELSSLVAKDFSDLRILTDDYLRFKYGNRLPKAMLKAITSKPLRGFAAPSVYILARRP